MNKDIKFLLLDVDGTMTDGGIYITDDGKQFKKFNAKDGMGIKKAINSGIEVGIISHSHTTEMVDTRANMLGLKHVYIGQRPKLEVMDEWLTQMKIDRSQVAFMGDDLNDIDIMEKVGLSACPADAAEEVFDVADLTMTKDGGFGAVREFIDKHLLR